MSEGRLNLRQFQEGHEPDQEAKVWLEASRIAARQGNLDEARLLAQAAEQQKTDSSSEEVSNSQRGSQSAPQAPEDSAEEQGTHPAPADTTGAQRGSQSAPAPTAGNGPERNGAWSWILGLLAVVASILLVAVLVMGANLVWGPVDTSLAALLSTATPTPTPAPTLTPGQIVAEFIPQMQEAIEGSNWARALEILDIMQSVDPAGDETQQWALATHMHYGQALVQAGQMEAALDQFELAVALPLSTPEAALWQKTTQLYLAGRQALNAGDWDAASHAFTLALEQMPDYGDLDARLTETYRRQGQTAMGAGDWPLAIAALNLAHERAPDDTDVTYLLSKAYRGQAEAAVEAGDWTVAIESLTEATGRLPGDAEIVDQLFSLYRQRGITREENGNLHGARADLEAALALRPDDAETKTHLGQVMYRLFPPKRIEISISKQRFYGWEGDRLVFNYPTSTGLRGMDTAAGNFRVQSKIPNAYSSIWRLHMPYWLGIYWVGNVENGIHALPIRPDGSVMWGGLLGQRASYGCVILSTSAARAVYNWAEIGTPVHIHY